MRLTLDNIVHATGGRLFLSETAKTPVLTSVVADSRKVTPGALFVALSGERVDGHDFAFAAVGAGAGAILAERNPFSGQAPVPVIVVESSVVALGRLARAWRDLVVTVEGAPRVIGVTGTAGKTTVKELLAQVLARRGRTARNYLNLNNQIGLPLSMLAADGQEAFWVMEVGISRPGDMDALGAILQPDLGLVLNVGPGHVEGLGDRGVAHYKARLFAHLRLGGMAMICADYPELVREARAIRPDLIFFSATGRQVEYRSAYVVPAGEGRGLFRLWLDGESVDVEAPFQGAFGAENVIAVAAVAHRLGLSPMEIAGGLAGATLPAQRFSCSRAGSWIIVDDSYNANPLSVARTLEAATEMATSLETETGSPAPLICVMGEMGELGAVAAVEHERLGRRLAEVKARAVFWKGGHGEDVLAGLEDGQYEGPFWPVSGERDFLVGLAHLAAQGFNGGVIVFKGSRANRLEELVHAFVKRAERAKCTPQALSSTFTDLQKIGK